MAADGAVDDAVPVIRAGAHAASRATTPMISRGRMYLATIFSPHKVVYRTVR